MQTAVTPRGEIAVISNSNFQRTVLESEKPVLLMCTANHQGGVGQTHILTQVMAAYAHAIDVFRLEEDFINGFKQMYNIKGTPVFLLFDKGELKGRMLGMADRERLDAFLSQMLPPNGE